MKNKKLVSAIRFFVSVYLVSAVLYLPILLSGRGISSAVTKLAMLLITFVPSITGIIFVYRTRSRDERRDFWRRVLRWPVGKTGQALVYLFLFPCTILISLAVSYHFAGKPLPFSNVLSLFRDWRLLLQFLLVEFFLGAVSEELGWRGFVLDELQSRFRPLASGLLLGVVWAFWHTPAFLIPGLSQYEMGGIFSMPYFSFLITVVMTSVIHTHAYNATGKSVLTAGVLMHFASNATLVLFGGIFDAFYVPPLFWIFQPVLTFAAAAVTTFVSSSRARAVSARQAAGSPALRT